MQQLARQRALTPAGADPGPFADPAAWGHVFIRGCEGLSRATRLIQSKRPL
jgi:hypothetical protein